ncbi:MAG: beta-galactosidase [Parcubacteria group bacterium]|nr:beta-galactosidase [Parcubacteria group bacterium]
MPSKTSSHRHRLSISGENILYGMIVVALFVAIWVSVVSLTFIVKDSERKSDSVEYGMTFSKLYANELRLDWKATYLAMLDDMQIRLFRLPAYWPDIEPEDNVYDFSDMDWMIEQASQRNARIILAIGRKLPRWPECHEPVWLKDLSESEKQSKVLEMLPVIVDRYRSESRIIAIQIENEPLFPFGECPKPSLEFLKKEIDIVKKSAPDIPVILTDSGELSTWFDVASQADILGISLYRLSWNPFLGYLHYPLTPEFYRDRADIISSRVDDILITEVQAEPWVHDGMLETPPSEQYRSMNLEILKNNLDFVERVGFPEALLWGGEWWYWLKENGNPEIWEFMKEKIREGVL